MRLGWHCHDLPGSRTDKPQTQHANNPHECIWGTPCHKLPPSGTEEKKERRFERERDFGKEVYININNKKKKSNKSNNKVKKVQKNQKPNLNLNLKRIQIYS